MIVSEAKTKVCPYMNGFSYFHDGTLNTHLALKCICGECMAWITTKTHSDTLMETFVETTSRDKNGNIHHVVQKPKELDPDNKEGYCSRLDK